MIVNIINGEVTLKDFCSRGAKKAINKALYDNAKFETDGRDEYGGQKMKIADFNMEAVSRSEDAALIEMTSKITIDGADVPVTIEAFDAMQSTDVDKIIVEINKITTSKIPLV